MADIYVCSLISLDLTGVILMILIQLCNKYKMFLMQYIFSLKKMITLNGMPTIAMPNCPQIPYYMSMCIECSVTMVFIMICCVVNLSLVKMTFIYVMISDIDLPIM